MAIALRRGATATTALVLLGAVLAALLTVMAGSPAHAAETRCALVKPTDDDTISILGRICDRREKPPVAVPGVRVTVEDEAGEELGEATSSEDGTFVIDLPGTSIEHLGKSYTVVLDESTLPEGTKPEITSRTIDINLDNDQTVIFPIGDAGPAKPSKFTEALQLMVGGLVFSVLLAMAALGLSMIFGTTGLTNFAHGELITFGALVAFFIDRLPGRIEVGGTEITVIVGVLGAFLVGGVFGWLNDTALWRPLRRRGTGLVAMMIVSIGLSLFLRNIYQYFAGAQTRNYSQYGAVEPWEIGDILLTPKELTVILLGVAVLVLTTSLLQFTRLGKATRAVADNPGLASATGINVERVIGTVWIGGAALAALAGALLGVTQGFDFQLGFRILLLVFAATVLGGLGTIWGAIVGAFVIGLFTELSTLFVDPEFKFVGALLLLIVILLIRPQGLLGKAQRIG
ncbi:ABC transporter permease subunit [Nocardioides stalactiti]|uniref:ABC transporter permease subunit n=1 Tax=Nocardioides stalactiti TaxID=2755356 RepID=UPI00160396CA|nr:branched-chain amino acid ABC transporter permease [Nocardioides stalactiti]